MSMCGENRCYAIFVDNHGVIEGVPGTILEVVGIAAAGCEIQRKLAAYEVVYIARDCSVVLWFALAYGQ